MKKSKKIISALVSVVMCTGIIGVLTANASKATPEPEQSIGETSYIDSNTFTTRTNVMPSEEFHKMNEEIGVVDMSVPKTPSQELVNEAFSVGVCHGSEYVEKVAEKIESTLGISPYPTSAPISIEDLNSPERAYGFFPTSSTKLPYPIYLGETSNGTAVASKYYFYVTGKPLELQYALQVRGNNGQKATLKTSLYRERTNWADMDSWQFVKSWNNQLSAEAGSEYTISDVDSDYVYCLVFENTSGFNCTISGCIAVSE